MFAAFMRLHDGLEREAPGSRDAARRALALSGAGGPVSVAEMGCGPGASVAVLLDLLPEAHVTGLDLHAPYLSAAARRADALGQGHRFTGVIGDMGAPPLSGPFDLIWSEGAIYSVGVAEGLRVWRDLLKPGGIVAFSDAVWLTADPDPRARAVFEDF